MTVDQIIHDMLVYFVPTLILTVVLVIGNAVCLQRDMKKRGWRREDEPPWDDDKE